MSNDVNQFKNWEKLKNQYKKILSNQEFSCVTFAVDSLGLPAYKFILKFVGKSFLMNNYKRINLREKFYHNFQNKFQMVSSILHKPPNGQTKKYNFSTK